MKKGIKTITIGDNLYHYSPGYFPENKWIDNDTLVIERSVYETIGNVRDNPQEVELVKLSLKDNSMEVLVRDYVMGYHYFVYGNKVYYSNRKNIKTVDVITKEVNTVYSYEGENNIYCLSVTNDGSVIAFEIGMSDGPEEQVIIDAKTGKVRDSFVYEFPKPYMHAEHTMICPANPDLLYFCHEGTTEYIPNRMWLHDAKTGKNWNFARQKFDENFNLAEYYGHEMWAPDGKGMYFVKYPQSPLKPTGLCYVDVKKGNTKLLFEGYPYWHVGVSRDGKYLMADTMRGVYDGGNECDIIVADLTDMTQSIVAVAKSSGQHPCHPHPQLSPDNDKIIFTSLDEKGRTVMKITFLE